MNSQKISENAQSSIFEIDPLQNVSEFWDVIRIIEIIQEYIHIILCV